MFGDRTVNIPIIDKHIAEMYDTIKTLYFGIPTDNNRNEK